MPRHFTYALCTIFALLLTTACTNDNDSTSAEPPFGYYHFDGQQIPVLSAVEAVGAQQLIVRLAPFEDNRHATTYAIIGVHNDLRGRELNVERYTHNYDYFVVYENPVYYHGVIRPLRSGTIYLNRSNSGVIDIRVDVVLHDGTPFRYENRALQAASPEEEEF